MQIHLLKSLEELSSYAEEWDRLAGELPFRSWTWLSHWWRSYGLGDEDCPDFRAAIGHQKNNVAWQYGAGQFTAQYVAEKNVKHPREQAPGLNNKCDIDNLRLDKKGLSPLPRLELTVLAVFDESDKLVGIAPCYLDHSLVRGRVLRMLGSGEVCSDYLGLLCRPGVEEAVVETIADFLLEGPADYPHKDLNWDLILLDGVDFQDYAVNRLAERMSGRGCKVHRRLGVNCWRLDLPATWEEYLKILSGRYRNQIRRLEKDYFETGRAVLHTIEQVGDLPWAMDLLVDMHQRRRRSLGQPGSFASPRFESFIRGVLPELMRQGRLQFYWLELDGRPAALEYHLTGGGILYEYQTGVEPEALEFQPGKLLNLAAIRRAVQQGYRAVDFLRGDEPYKAHFRAAARPSLEVRIVPNRASALFRHNLWLAGSNVKKWMKKGIRMGTQTGSAGF